MSYLHYVYQTKKSATAIPLLIGSAIRALGKGWTVGVYVTPSNEKYFLSLRTSLRDPNQLVILSKDAAIPHVDLLLTDQQYKEKLSFHVMSIEPNPTIDAVDLVSKVESVKSNQSVPRIIAITGNGKGKTTGALGIAHMLKREGKVAVIQWFKERKGKGLTWSINEHEFPSKLHDPNSFSFHPTGLGFFGSPTMDRIQGEYAYKKHKKKAKEGVELAYTLLASKKHNVLLLDEFIDTTTEVATNLEYPLLSMEYITTFLSDARKQSTTQVILTGRRVTAHFENLVDQTIQITEVKHPWSSRGTGAVGGLDY